MSDLILDSDFSWDEPKETAVSGGRKHFAKLRFFPVPVVPFQKGQSITLPNVFDDKFDEASGQTLRQGLKEFKGYKNGKTSEGHTLYVLVAEQSSKDGGSYQVIKQFKSWPDKGRENLWAKFQYPALRTISDPAIRSKLTAGQEVYASFEDMPTGEMVDINGSSVEMKYWGNFTVYQTADALKNAEVEFFANIQTGSNGAGPDVTNIPAKWYANSQSQEAKTSNIQAMLTYIKQQIDSGKPASDVAKSTAMEGTSPALNANGQPVNLAALFAQATGMPEAMFTF